MLRKLRNLALVLGVLGALFAIPAAASASTYNDSQCCPSSQGYQDTWNCQQGNDPWQGNYQGYDQQCGGCGNNYGNDNNFWQDYGQGSCSCGMKYEGYQGKNYQDYFFCQPCQDKTIWVTRTVWRHGHKIKIRVPEVVRSCKYQGYDLT
jgi:hypothetical protein